MLLDRNAPTTPRNVPDEPNEFLQGPQLLFEVEGKSFMYKQVRNMV